MRGETGKRENGEMEKEDQSVPLIAFHSFSQFLLTPRLTFSPFLPQYAVTLQILQVLDHFTRRDYVTILRPDIEDVGFVRLLRAIADGFKRNNRTEAM